MRRAYGHALGIVGSREDALDLHRTERGIAWTLIAAGGAVLASVALWRWLESWLVAEVPLLIKLATGALMIGGALLLVSVIRERWVLSRRDPYSKEVLR